MTDTIEIVVAKWSSPAREAEHRLKAWIEKNGWRGELVVIDHDTMEPDGNPVFQGWGECRLNEGPWMKVPELLDLLNLPHPKDMVSDDPKDAVIAKDEAKIKGT